MYCIARNDSDPHTLPIGLSGSEGDLRVLSVNQSVTYVTLNELLLYNYYDLSISISLYLSLSLSLSIPIHISFSISIPIYLNLYLSAYLLSLPLSMSLVIK